MQLFERAWDLNADLLEEEGFDADSIRLHALSELDEDMARIEREAKIANLSEECIYDLQRRCQTRNRQHWREYAAT